MLIEIEREQWRALATSNTSTTAKEPSRIKHHGNPINTATSVTTFFFSVYPNNANQCHQHRSLFQMKHRHRAKLPKESTMAAEMSGCQKNCPL